MVRIAPLVDRPAWLSLRAAGTLLTRRDTVLHVTGLEHVPGAGPVILAARHYHHLYDGCALLAVSTRPTHILVANDWAEAGWQKRALGAACRLARWPTVSRPDSINNQRGRISTDERFGNLRRASALATQILLEGRVLLVFPEGYPTIDPQPTPKRSEDQILPFQSGFADIAWHAQRHGAGSIPIIPVGLAYTRGERWSITMRFGEPLALTAHAQKPQVIAAAQEQVRALSGLAPLIEATR